MSGNVVDSASHEEHPRSPEEWRWFIKSSLDTLGRDVTHIHECLERRAEDVCERISSLDIKIDGLDKRISPLEHLRSMMIGGLALLIFLGPLWWWLILKVLPLIEKAK